MDFEQRISKSFVVQNHTLGLSLDQDVVSFWVVYDTVFCMLLGEITAKVLSIKKAV
jgi:hypothetical protein